MKTLLAIILALSIGCVQRSEYMPMADAVDMLTDAFCTKFAECGQEIGGDDCTQTMTGIVWKSFDPTTDQAEADADAFTACAEAILAQSCPLSDYIEECIPLMSCGTAVTEPCE